MRNQLESLITKIRSIGDEYCENQMYVWPGFHHTDPDPDAFFRKRGIEFDGELYIRYPVKKTFNPISVDQLAQQERSLGVTLPNDYKVLLQQFGEFHLPGRANVMIESLAAALETTRRSWCFGGKPLSVLAVSPYNNTSDGNSIGYIRNGDAFGPAVYEFDHELRHRGDDPSLWTNEVSSSLVDFLIEYLDRRD